MPESLKSVTSSIISAGSKEAKSLAFLAYSFVMFYYGSILTETMDKTIFYSVGVFAFSFASLKFLRDSKFSLPIIPCKERCNLGKQELICTRDKGFLLGFIAIVPILASYKFFSNLSLIQNLLLFVICTGATLLHGTIRRIFGHTDSMPEKILTFSIGLLTGTGIIFAYNLISTY